MTFYSLPDDGTMSEAERARQAIQEARDIRADDGPARTFHPDGPCSWALHGCRTCEAMEAAYRRTSQALEGALTILLESEEAREAQDRALESRLDAWRDSEEAGNG